MKLGFPGFSRSLHARALGAFGAGLLATVAVAWMAGSQLGLTGTYSIKAGTVFLGVLLIALSRISVAHPFERFGLANQVTTLRAALVSIVAGMVGEPSLDRAAVAIVCGSACCIVLDGIDGWLARRSRMASAFGARFDMEMDALLILSLSALTWQYGKAGVWILAAGLLRYAFIAGTWLFESMRTPLFPSWRRKTVCIVQILGLSVLMVPALRPPLSIALSAALLLALSWSFLIDTFWLFAASIPGLSWRRQLNLLVCQASESRKDFGRGEQI